MVQQNYFSNLYPAKILDLSAKPFFPCIINFRLERLQARWIHGIPRGRRDRGNAKMND